MAIGLDLRGSRVVVVNNELSGAADKAASVGEESEVLFVSNRLGHSAIGVAVKDLSTAYLYDNRFKENDRDVRANMKQPFFGGGRVVFAGDRSGGGGRVGRHRRARHTDPYTRRCGQALRSDRPTARARRRGVQRTVRGIRGPVNRFRLAD